MGELKRKREALEERKEKREIDREGRLAALSELEERGGLDVPALTPQAPTTAEFDDSATRGMFGDVVQVVTTLDSLGCEDEDEAEAKAYLDDLAAKRQRLAAEAQEAQSAANGKGKRNVKKAPVDQAQRYAYSFKAIKEKIDAAPLTTKRQRQAKRNKSQSHFENKGGVPRAAAGQSESKGKKGKLTASQLTAKAIKTATFGKKKKKL